MNKEFLAKKKDIDELKNGKVDKEEGKGLSQNDFTNIHKEAVEAIPEELQHKADLFHTHSKSDINDLDSALDEKLSVASRNYVPVRYISDSMNFDTDFQLTSTDPNKVIFTNTKSVFPADFYGTDERRKRFGLCSRVSEVIYLHCKSFLDEVERM